LFRAREIVGVLRERQVAGLGAVGGREVVQQDGAVADELTLQQLGNFSSSNWHKQFSENNLSSRAPRLMPGFFGARTGSNRVVRKSFIDLKNDGHYKVHGR
jgi:hypothetical protein